MKIANTWARLRFSAVFVPVLGFLGCGPIQPPSLPSVGSGGGSPTTACSINHVLAKTEKGWTRVPVVEHPDAVDYHLEYIDSVKREVASLPGVLEVQADPLVSAAAEFTNWGVTNSGASAAWVTTTGSTGVKIAVIDTGVQSAHPDLSGNIQATGTLFDVIESDDTPQDLNGHGTHVAGIIAAVHSNGTGIRGMMGASTILPIRVLNASGVGTMSGVATGINRAVAAGANILNLSLGSNSTPPTVLTNALRDAADSGVIAVVAAGNEGLNNDQYASYPANTNLENIISVAAHNSSNTRPSWSNYGLNNVGLSAPGVDILSLYPTSLASSGLATESGTSMAAPHVAGALGLIWARATALAGSNPASYSIFTSDARNLAPLTRSLLLSHTVNRSLNVLTGGALKVDSALSALESIPSGTMIAGPHLARVAIGRSVRMVVAGGVGPYTWTYDSGDNIGSFSNGTGTGADAATFTPSSQGVMFYKVTDSSSPARTFVGKLVSFVGQDQTSSGTCTP